MLSQKPVEYNDARHSHLAGSVNAGTAATTIALRIEKSTRLTTQKVAEKTETVKTSDF